jgi:hypothetical protein
MAFNMNLKPTFVARINVETANSKGGIDSSHFMCEFKRPTLDQLDAHFKQKPIEFLPEVIVGWSELNNNGEPVAFNEDHLAALLSIPSAILGLREAYFEAAAKAKSKN